MQPGICGGARGVKKKRVVVLMAKKRKVQMVRWIDASFSFGPHDAEHKLPCAYAETLGFLIAEDDENVTLAGEIFDDGTRRTVTTIPKVCIIKRKTLWRE